MAFPKEGSFPERPFTRRITRSTPIALGFFDIPDIYVPCEVCKGKRYNRETLEVKYKGKNIADVLNMTVEESLEFFDKIPKIKQKMQTLYDVGLGYIKLRTTIYYIIRRGSTKSKTCNRVIKKSNWKNIVYIR